MENEVNDEVNLVDYIKVVKRRKVTIILVILTGIVVSLSIPKLPTTYQSIGYYKISGNFLPTERKEQAKQFVSEAKVRYPGIKVSESSSIITITTTDSDAESSIKRQISIAKELKIKEIVAIKNIVVKPKAIKVMLPILFIFLGIFAGAIKEWWENNKGKI